MLSNNKQLLKYISRMVILLAVPMMLMSCNNGTSRKTEKQVSKKQLKESLFEANKKAVKTEDQQIDDFISRHHWNMIKTGTGLRYSIYEHGKGEKATDGKVAVIDYEVSLLNGDVVYSSEQTGPKEFMIGRGGVPSGLEEGILFLHVGDRAKFIIPSHLAYGLAGDQHKITGKTTLVYDVKLLKIR